MEQNSNKLEPIWTYQAKLQNLNESLNKKLDDSQIYLESKINKSQKLSLEAAASIKANLKKEINSHLEEFNNLKSFVTKEFKDLKENLSYDINDLTSSTKEEVKELRASALKDVNLIKASLQESLNSYDKEHNNKINQVFNSLKALNKKINTIEFDIIDNENNISITYINPLGKTEYLALRKNQPDEKTLTYDENKNLKLKYNFDPIDLSTNNNLIKVKALSLNSGDHLTGDRIKNDLSNASYNIKDLTYKLEQLEETVNSSHGYIASNDFKNNLPSQDSLTQFALDCISTSDRKLKKEQLPNGVKIKNLYDNHIWVFNKISLNGLTTFKWEDFGSDSLCIANNNGVHGIVSGSHDKYKGYIDMQGNISINGLEEDLENIFESLQNLNINFDLLHKEVFAKLDSLESKIKLLE